MTAPTINTFDGVLQEVCYLISVTSVHGGGKEELAFNLIERITQQDPAPGQRFPDQRLERDAIMH